MLAIVVSVLWRRFEFWQILVLVLGIAGFAWLVSNLISLFNSDR